MNTLLVLFLAGAGAADFQSGHRAFYDGDFEQCVAVLSAWIPASPESEQIPAALYFLGLAHMEIDQPEEALAVFRELSANRSNSEMAAAAMKQRVHLSLQIGRLDECREAAEPFLEWYLGRHFSTVDSAVSRGIFDALIQAELGGVDVPADAETRAAAIRRLRGRFAPESAAGRVVEVFAGPDRDAPDANLIVNPGFELDGRPIGLPFGWRYLGTDPNYQDDLDGVLPDGGQDQKIRSLEGRFCAGKYTEWGIHRGWLHQTVEVTPGQAYVFAAHAYTPYSNDPPGQVRIGADPAGGVNPEGEGIIWTDYASPSDKYVRFSIGENERLASPGGRITVFLEVLQTNPSDPNALLFDGVSLQRVK